MPCSDLSAARSGVHNRAAHEESAFRRVEALGFSPSKLAPILSAVSAAEVNFRKSLIDT